MSGLLLYAHILGASLALAAGTAALVFKKGSLRHKRSGKLFVYSMGFMALSAVPLALEIGKVLDAMSSLLVCYLVLTSIRTFASHHHAADWVLTGLGTFTLTGYLWVEYQGATTGVRATDAPEGAGYVFALILLAAVTGDVAFQIKQGFTRLHRLIRHLWRMCFAFFMATTSFFLARSHLFPDWFAQSGLLVLLGLAPLIMMFYWTGHSYLTYWWRQRKIHTAKPSAC